MHPSLFFPAWLNQKIFCFPRKQSQKLNKAVMSLFSFVLEEKQILPAALKCFSEKFRRFSGTNEEEVFSIYKPLCTPQQNGFVFFNYRTHLFCYLSYVPEGTFPFPCTCPDTPFLSWYLGVPKSPPCSICASTKTFSVMVHFCLHALSMELSMEFCLEFCLELSMDLSLALSLEFCLEFEFGI